MPARPLFLSAIPRALQRLQEDDRPVWFSREIAELLGVSRRTVARLLKETPAARAATVGWVIARRDLADLLTGVYERHHGDRVSWRLLQELDDTPKVRLPRDPRSHLAGKWAVESGQVVMRATSLKDFMQTTAALFEHLKRSPSARLEFEQRVRRREAR